MSTILQGIVTKKPNKVPEKGEIFFSSEKIQEMSITMKLVIQSDKDLFFFNRKQIRCKLIINSIQDSEREGERERTTTSI